MKTNYQLLCDAQIDEVKKLGKKPSLLLHSCCGPCSSYVLEYLTEFFDVTVFYYNPNIFPEAEYEKRLETQRTAIEKLRGKNKISILNLPYDHGEFTAVSNGLENAREGGERCAECFRLRLKKTAETAREKKYDYFTTTLSVSPHKNAEILNRLGAKMSEETGVRYLYADFKKREGYKRSIELSKEFGLYRQNYCGCEFSLPAERDLNTAF